MSVPLAELLEPRLPESIREIERDYQIRMVAESTVQLRQYHAAALRVQLEAAAQHLQATAELGRQQERANNYLSDIQEGMSSLLLGVDRISNNLENLGNIADQTLGAVWDLSGMLDDHLTCLSEQILEQQETLKDIAQILRRPYQAKARELRQEAEKWLFRGMNHQAGDREEDWEDAIRLLQTTVENPIGMQDYVAFFQIGWLTWKLRKNIAEAELAFHRAQRLSRDNGDLYHVLSLRHVAYMQYLQRKHQKAYETISRAMDIERDHDTMFDAARYAAKIGREKEAIDLLDQCIELQPCTIITMFAEVDFR